MAQLDIMGSAEVAQFLGVSKARVYAMTRDRILPRPDARPACGPIWRRSTIERFAASWTRLQGQASEFYGRRDQ